MMTCSQFGCGPAALYSSLSEVGGDSPSEVQRFHVGFGTVDIEVVAVEESRKRQNKPVFYDETIQA